ncbi:hypothetical protein LA080_006540 [Diaporthe eres]|nr:hypothetical protein LA080_006540 [Diaporthe eres]
MPTAKFADNEHVIKGDRRGFVNHSTYDAVAGRYTVRVIVTFKEMRRERMVSTPSGGVRKQEYWSDDLTGNPGNVWEDELAPSVTHLTAADKAQPASPQELEELTNGKDSPDGQDGTNSPDSNGGTNGPTAVVAPKATTATTAPSAPISHISSLPCLRNIYYCPIRSNKE